MELFLVILGGLLAISGGVVTHWLQHRADELKADQETLFTANQLLLQYHAAGESSVKVQAERIRLRGEISEAALRLRSKKHRSTAVELTKFVLDEPFRTSDNLYAVTRRVQLAVNSPVIEQYEEELERLSAEMLHARLRRGQND